MKLKQKLIKFFHVKSYIEHGAVPMKGIIDKENKNIIRGLECDGIKMEPYLYFKNEWALTKEDAILLGNKIIKKEIKYHQKQIDKLKLKLIK